MAQVTWRADDELVRRAKRSAAALNRSLNEYLSLVLDVATDPDRAGSDVERVRARLLDAGLLAPAPRRGARPSTGEVEAAGRRAAVGTPLSALVTDGR